MKTTVLKIISFFLILVALDFAAGSLVRKIYFRQKQGPGYSLTYTLDSCKEDILIFGNSRAQHHYKPIIFANNLNMSCYNAGLDGGHSILFIDAVLSEVLKRYSPEVVIVEVDPESFNYYQPDYDKLSILSPYLNEHPDFKKTIELRGPFERLKMLSQVYRFNFPGILNMVRFAISKPLNPAKDSLKGYSPLEKFISYSYSDPEKNHFAPTGEPDYNKLNALKDIIRNCKEKNVQLLLVNSPVYSDVYPDLENSSSIAKNVLMDKQVNFWNYAKDERFIKNQAIFADRMHLNLKGADLFSKTVAERLKEFSNSKN